MNAELRGFRDRRNDLTKELALLSEREAVLRAKTYVLEKMLKARESGGPMRPAKGQKGLETAEDLADERNWIEIADLRTQPLVLKSREKQLPRAGRSKLVRVRLKKNAIFSWSYTKRAR